MILRRALALPALLACAACSGKNLDGGSTRASEHGSLSVMRATLGALVDAATMDDTSLYFTCEDGWVYRLEKTGTSTPQRIAPAPAPGSPYTEGIAVDDTDVYWTALGDGLTGGAVMRAPKSGGDAVVIAGQRTRPWGIALDDTYVYWADQGASGIPDNVGGIGNGSLQRVAKAGGSPMALAVSLTSPDVIALDGGGVLWHEASTLRRVALDGGAITTLFARPVVFPTSRLVVAEGRVFWAEDMGEEASILSTPSSGGAVAALAENVDRPAGMAMQGGSLFWNVATGSNVGAILGLPASGDSPSVVWPSDAHAGAQEDRALFLLADAAAFYAIESWAATDLTVAIRMLPR